MSRDLLSDSERAALALEKYEKFYGRRDEGWQNRPNDNGGGDGCLGAIIMLVIATFSVGAGIFYCI